MNIFIIKLFKLFISMWTIDKYGISHSDVSSRGTYYCDQGRVRWSCVRWVLDQRIDGPPLVSKSPRLCHKLGVCWNSKAFRVWVRFSLLYILIRCLRNNINELKPLNIKTDLQDWRVKGTVASPIENRCPSIVQTLIPQ